MSDIQGIIVCGEASESEDEEFCAAVAKGQLESRKMRCEAELGSSTQQSGSGSCDGHHHQHEKQQNRVHQSLLHQKLWETNALLERNLSHSIVGPLEEQATRLSQLMQALPGAQTSTLSAHAALTQAAQHLTNINLHLENLSDNPLNTLKAL